MFRFPAELRSSGRTSNWKTNRLFPGYQTSGPRDWERNNGADPRTCFFNFKDILKHFNFYFSVQCGRLSKIATRVIFLNT